LDGKSARLKAATYTYRAAQTEQIQSYIHASSVIRIRDPRVRAGAKVHALDRTATAVGASSLCCVLILM
jgi:hypothetical protein